MTMILQEVFSLCKMKEAFKNMELCLGTWFVTYVVQGSSQWSMRHKWAAKCAIRMLMITHWMRKWKNTRWPKAKTKNTKF